MFMDQRDSMLRTQRSCALPGGESDPGQAAVSRERPWLTSSLSVGSIPSASLIAFPTGRGKRCQ